MIDRRTFLTLAGLATLPIPAAFATQPPLPDEMRETFEKLGGRHPLFATKRIGGISEWQRCGTGMSAEVDEKAIKDAAGRGINLVAEVQAAVRQEIVAGTEQEWLQPLRAIPPTLVFDMDTVEVENATFVGDLHTMLGTMIQRAAPSLANTVIVSPTALTILQSSTCNAFMRYSTGATMFRDNPYPTSMKEVGKLHGTLNVLVDPYAGGEVPVLIGYVPEEDEDRAAALVQTGISTFEFGQRTDKPDTWVTVGIKVESLRFF